MNERLICLTFEDGEVGVTLGATYRYISIPFGITIVAVSVSPSADDAALTLDINDDGAAAIAGISCAVKATPGEWNSTHVRGSNAPVHVAAGSVLSLDANNAAADTRLLVHIWALTDEIAG